MLRYTLCIVPIFIFLGFTAAFLFELLYVANLVPSSGQVLVSGNIEEYGFGLEQKLVIIDITQIGGVDNIDFIDKKLANITIKDSFNVYYTGPVGIEIKGDGLPERRQLNFDLELWEWDDDEWDDHDEKLFGWEEDYSDYVLRGCYLENTCTRDLLPTVMSGSRYRAETVEVLLKNDQTYTYEGVYIMMQDIGRKLYYETDKENNEKWATKGKTVKDKDGGPCSPGADPLDIALLFKGEDVKRRGASRSAACGLEKLYNIKMVYPKCKFYEDIQSTNTTCYNLYTDRVHQLYGALNLVDVKEPEIDYDSFVGHFIGACLVRQKDFGYVGASSYMYVKPNQNTIYAGTMYDLDNIYWRMTVIPNPLDLPVYANDVKTIWHKLGQDPVFIAKLRQNGSNILNFDIQQAETLYKNRMEENSLQYFDRHITRWNTLGKRLAPPIILSVYLLFGSDAHTKPTFEEELVFQIDLMKERATRINNELQQITSVNSVLVDYISLALANYWIYCVVYILLIVYLVGIIVFMLVKRSSVSTGHVSAPGKESKGVVRENERFKEKMRSMR